MSVYIYSPGNKIQLDYVVESYLLKRHGTYKQVIDLLITNKSDNQIKRLDIIFPHRLIKIFKKKNKFQIIPSGSINDITNTFFEKDSNYNILLHQQSNKIKWESSNNLVSTLKLIMPDPNNPLSDIDYFGYIKGKSHLELHDDLSLLQKNILYDLEISYLFCAFEMPLIKDEARWLRLEFDPNNATINEINGFDYWFKYCSGSIRYSYEILGPNDIKDKILNKLGCYYIECINNNIKNKDSLIFECQSINQKINIDGFNVPGTETKILDWKINIFPFDYHEISSLNISGDILQSGSMPKYIDYSENQLVYKKGKKSIPGEYCYQYQTGERFIYTNLLGKFQIRFMAIFVSEFQKKINFLAFILAVIAIILTLIS